MFDFLLKVQAKYLVTSDFKTVEKKFLDQGIEKPLVKDYLTKFKDLRDKNKISGDDKNIDLWGKKSFKDFKSFVDKISKVKTKTEEKKEARVEGAKLIAENAGWKVYEITSHKAARLYGSNTKWCITEADGVAYEEYGDKNNIYFLISKKLNPRETPWAKMALLVDREGKKTYWDVLDKSHRSVPQDLNIPTFKKKVPTHILIGGKRYEDLNNLPKNLKVAGDLDLRNTKITSLPEGLEVAGYLNLEGTKITLLPKGLKVGRHLILRGTEVTSLPEGLKVGHLNLFGTKITSLPEGLKVGGNLVLKGTKITSLPEGLNVGGYLDLRGTKITSLPEGLNVGGYLDLRGTKITSLPEGLSVGGFLDLSGTKITPLPEKLKVGGSLNLYGTEVTSLPEGLKVGEYIYVKDPSRIQCSDELRKKIRT